MADQKITQLTSLAGADAATNDVIPIVDVSATTTKKMTRTEFFLNTSSIQSTSGIVRAGDYADDGLKFVVGRYQQDTPYFALSTAGSGTRMDAQVAYGHELRFTGSGDINFSNGGNVGIGTTTPSQKLSVSGNVTITGSLSKGSGSFRIPHPIREGHDLVHSFVEGPQADNIYRGRVALVDGTATVNLDEAGRMTEGTFVALNGNIQCFTSNETDWCPVRGSVVGNILTIEAQDNTCTDTISWLVIGERIDQHMIDTDWTDDNGRVITEPEKIAEAT